MVWKHPPKLERINYGLYFASIIVNVPPKFSSFLLHFSSSSEGFMWLIYIVCLMMQLTMELVQTNGLDHSPNRALFHPLRNTYVLPGSL